MQAVMDAAHDAAVAKWYVQEATIGEETTVAATNPTDPNDTWIYVPSKKFWVHFVNSKATDEGATLIPFCKHRDLPSEPTPKP